MPFLPFSKVDLLIVEELGKNISGTGIDPNITGRRCVRGEEQEGNLEIGRIVCLGLTAESHGNATGMGIADFVPKSFFDQVDFAATYRNVLTSGLPERGFLPIVQDSDEMAIKSALNCCGHKVTWEDVRLVQIENTLKVEEMLVSVPLLTEVSSGVEWEELETIHYQFSEDGKLFTRLGQ